LRQLREAVDRLIAEEGSIAGRLAALGKHQVAVEGVFSLDTEGRIIYADDVMHRLAGYDPPELIGMPWEHLLGDQHRDAYKAIFDHYVSSGDWKDGWAGPLVFPLRQQDGSERPMLVRVSPQQALGKHVLLVQLRPASSVVVDERP